MRLHAVNQRGRHVKTVAMRLVGQAFAAAEDVRAVLLCTSDRATIFFNCPSLITD
ncbi:MAG: hypothetical protein U0V48_11490 [Anaerolineales bacterium]